MPRLAASARSPANDTTRTAMTTPVRPRDPAHLEELRNEIAALDGHLIDILARRLATAAEIGEIKQRLGLPV
ncbi:MAG: chorismate mutase, partial [Longimicrobiales bacterium]